jgi:hypothetical protein
VLARKASRKRWIGSVVAPFAGTPTATNIMAAWATTDAPRAREKRAFRVATPGSVVTNTSLAPASECGEVMQFSSSD